MILNCSDSNELNLEFASIKYQWIYVINYKDFIVHFITYLILKQKKKLNELNAIKTFEIIMNVLMWFVSDSNVIEWHEMALKLVDFDEIFELNMIGAWNILPVVSALSWSLADSQLFICMFMYMQLSMASSLFFFG